MSGKITEYFTVTDFVSYDLDQKVNDLIKQGWKLYGTPYVNGLLFCQPMVFEEYNKK